MEQNQDPGLAVTVVTGKCPLCREEGEVVLTLDQATRYQASRATGQFMQDALPDLPSGLREQLISGAHPACFDQAFGYDDDPDDPDEF